jgi:hypothetical protein
MYFLGTSVSTTEPECAMRYSIVDAEIAECSSAPDMLEDFDLQSEMPDPLSEIPDPLIPEMPVPIHSPAAKRRRVSTQDIQKMQFEVLALEKKKIELEVENMQLANQKLKIEIQELLARSQPLNLVIENTN